MLAVNAGSERSTPRTIRYWQSRGFVSGPIPRAGKSRYPLEAVGEADCLGRWPPRSVGVDLSTIARFVEVGNVPWGQARDAFARLLADWEGHRATARAKAQEDPGALRRDATRTAAKRGSQALPRVTRQRAEDRAKAHVHVLAGALGIEVDPHSHAAGQRAMEFMFGLRAGRGGALRDLTDLVDDPAATVVGPDRANAALSSASAPAIEMARRTVEFLSLWSPVLLAAIGDSMPRAFGSLVSGISGGLTPEFYAVFFTQRLPAIAEKDATEDRGALEKFECALAAAELYRDLSPVEARWSREALRPYARLQLRLASAGTRETFG